MKVEVSTPPLSMIVFGVSSLQGMLWRDRLWLLFFRQPSRKSKRRTSKRVPLVVVLGALVLVSCVAMFVLGLPSSSGPDRLVMFRKRAPFCLNTFSEFSADLTADALGKVCVASALGADGCCCGGERGCGACSASRCCSTYEHCVACCVTDGATRARARRKASHAVLADPSLSAWDFCKFRCLTNSGTVLHQNSYRSSLKNCYGLSRPSLDSFDLSVNAIDPDLEADDIDLDNTDPYVANGSSVAVSTFPCRQEGCAVPDQDRAKLKVERRRRQSSSTKNGVFTRSDERRTKKARLRGVRDVI